MVLFILFMLIFLPSFPSALQLRMSFGLLNNPPPFFSIPHLSSPSFHFHFTEIIYILQPSQPGSSYLCSIHSSETDCLVSEHFSFYGEVVSLMPNPQPGGPGYPSSSGSYPLTCPAWVILPVTKLPPAQLSGSQEHSNPTTTIRWKHHRWGYVNIRSDIIDTCMWLR
jgi:hypothetical protein